MNEAAIEYPSDPWRYTTTTSDLQLSPSISLLFLPLLLRSKTEVSESKICMHDRATAAQSLFAIIYMDRVFAILYFLWTRGWISKLALFLIVRYGACPAHKWTRHDF